MNQLKQERLKEVLEKLTADGYSFIKRDEQGIHITVKGPAGERVDVWPTTETWARMEGNKKIRAEPYGLRNFWKAIAGWNLPIEGA